MRNLSFLTLSSLVLFISMYISFAHASTGNCGSIFSGALVKGAAESNQDILAGKIPIPKKSEVGLNPQTTLIKNPDFLEAAIQIIRQAKKSIYISFYIFSGPRADAVLTEVLLKRAQGVEVKIILDGSDGGVTGPFMHAKHARAIRKRMKDENLNVVNITPVPFGFGRSGRRVRLKPSNHNKYILVDNDKSLVGAINLSPVVDKMEDFAVLLQGVDNSVLYKQFLFDFKMSNGTLTTKDYADLCSEMAGDKQTGSIRFRSNGHCRLEVLKSIVRMIDEAQKSIDIFVEEIEPVPELVSALEKAMNRGVKVRVITEEGDASFAIGPVGKLVPRQIISAHAIGKFLEMGIDVRLFDGARKRNTLHAKAMIVDGLNLNLGSANWSEPAFRWVYETNLEIRGGQAAKDFAEFFEVEFGRAESTTGPSPLSFWLRSVASWYLTRGAE